MRNRLSLLMTVALAMLAGLGLRGGAPARADDKPAEAKDEVALLQGRWETRQKDALPITGAARAVKDIKGNREAVTYYGEDGAIVGGHRAEFKIEAAGPVRIYTFFNVEQTLGSEKGTRTPGPISYIFRVETEALFEVHGVLATSPAGSVPTVVAWRRPGTAEPATGGKPPIVK